MTDYRTAFLSQAFKVVPGPAYNQARRDLLERADIAPLIYEIVLPDAELWESFRDRTFPLLVRYLKSQGVDPENPKGLIVAAFFRDHCHFIEGRRFMQVLQELEGLNSQALHFRILRWLTE